MVSLVHLAKSEDLMAVQVNIHEAKTHLSELLRRVEEGEEVTIARAGKPVAKIVRTEAPTRERRLGFWKGKIKEVPGWEAPLTDDEVRELFGPDYAPDRAPTS
jgi:prevent-host-death family protein